MFIEKSYPVLEILSSALNNNINLLRNCCNNNNLKVLVPVKANAYGCGLDIIIEYAKHHPSIDILGVANPYEAIQIREANWTKDILNLGGFYKQDIHLFLKYNIIPSITDKSHISILEAEGRKNNKIINVHLKLDLGMGRIGLLPSEINECIALLKNSKFCKIKGIFTHYPSSDIKPKFINRKNTPTLLQYKHFLDITDKIITDLKLERKNIILHSANSYATFHYPETTLDMIRPGLFFYGYFNNDIDKKKYQSILPLQPCLRLFAKPISYRCLSKGSSISYGSLYKIKKHNQEVAVLPLGYADGIPRCLTNNISFGKYPLLGRVTMDQIIVGNVNNEIYQIELLGENTPPLETWASKTNTISYEIMTNLGNRLQRILI